MIIIMMIKIKIFEDQPKKKVTFNNIIDSIEVDNTINKSNSNENNSENNDIMLLLKNMNDCINNIQTTVKENNDLLRELVNKTN